MTIEQRLERDLPEILGGLAMAPYPDYIDDVLSTTAARRQRPSWTFPERWLPVELVSQRVPTTRMPWRQLGVLALIAILLAAALAVYIGSRTPHLPPPFGPAANGAIVYGANGDIMVRDALTSSERVLIGGPTDDHDPGFSPDGTTLLFIRTIGSREYLMASGVDGSGAAQVFPEPLANPQVAWRFDSRAFAIVNAWGGAPHLYIARLDDSAVRSIDLGAPILPTDIAWRPPEGHELLVRGRSYETGNVDFYIVDVDSGSTPSIRPLRLDPHSNFGSDWDNSGPSWSLDGQRIAYNVVVKGAGDLPDRFRLHIVNADGSDDRQISQEIGKINEAWPFFSPDGRSILVQHFIWDDQPDASLWLAVLPSDGSASAHEVGPRLVGPDPQGYDRAWSPDGSRILAKAGSTGMFSIDPTDGSYTKLAWGDVPLGDWQRLGR